MNHAPARTVEVKATGVKSRKHFESLDALRGVAALIVVLYHLPDWYSPLFDFPLVRNGKLMVTFFFVLSGFVLDYGYGDRLRNGEGLWHFVILRFGRVYPVHVFFLFLFAGTELVKLLAEHYGVPRPPSGPNQNTPQSFVECLFLVHSLGFTGNDAAFNFPSWSISTEFYTYVLFAVFAKALSSRAMQVTAWTMAGAGIAALASLDSKLGTFENLVRCLAGFFLGVTLHRWYRRASVRTLPSLYAIVPLLAFLGFLCVRVHEGPEKELVFVLSSLVIMAMALSESEGIARVFRSAPLAWLGRISYSLYMAHAIVLWTARQLVRAVFKSGGPLPVPIALLLCAGSVVGALAMAQFSYSFVELPGRAAVRRYADGALKPRA